MRIFGKRYMTQDEWEETPHGKKFVEKMRQIAEENRRKHEEWEERADPRKLAVYRRLKKVFPCVYIPFALALFAGGFFNSLLYILITEAVISAIAVALYFVFPKEQEWRSSFLFVPLAFASAVICWGTILLVQGTGSRIFGGKATDAEQPAVAVEEPAGESADGPYESYEDFLRDKVLDENEELYDGIPSDGGPGND